MKLNITIPEFIKYWYPEIFEDKQENELKINGDIMVECFDDKLCTLLQHNDTFVIINKNISKMEEILKDFANEEFVQADIMLLTKLKNGIILEYNSETICKMELNLLCLVGINKN